MPPRGTPTDRRMPRKHERNPPPAGLDTAARKLWRRTRNWLMEQSLWDDIDAGALERYVRAVEHAATARKDLIDKRGKLHLTTRGSQGQLVQHPSVKTAREAERDAHEYAKELCLTPLARKRHEVGQDTDDDPLSGRT